ncbi:MAG: hypothetical protein Q8R16_02735 [bacterium]|nr:hypothetical protein [bacterium]
MKQRQRDRAARIALTTLGVIGVAGFLAAVAVAPGIALALKPFARRFPSRQRYDADRTVRNLIRRGLVEEVQRGRIVGYALTDRGREHLARHELAHAAFTSPKRWDKKWRMIIFDIPEKRRYLRDTLRAHFTRLGLYPIQKSVWLFPYACHDLVRLLKVDLGLGRSVQCFTVGEFEDREEEKDWRRHFDV